MTTRDEKIAQILQIFAGSKISSSDIEHHLAANDDNIDRTVDALLKPLTHYTTNNKNNNNHHHHNNTYKSPEEIQRQKKFRDRSQYVWR